jgi:hypothetical protein
MMARRAVADMEAWVRNIEWDEAVVPWDIDTDGLFAVAR